MGEELSDSEDIYVVFGSDETYSNSFDNLEETLPSLVAYLARGPPSDPDQHPEPLGGWEFPFEPSLLEWLVEDLEIEEKGRISLIADYQHHLLFHPEEVSPLSIWKPPSSIGHQNSCLFKKPSISPNSGFYLLKFSFIC